MDVGKVPGHMPDLVRSGDITLGYIAASYLADVARELYIFDLPFEIKSREQACSRDLISKGRSKM